MDGNRTRTARPIRVIQFGEGNFLRAFVDYMLDVANERGAFDGHVVIVKPTDRGNLDKFVRQDNFYTVLTRGRANGQVVDERRLIGCVERCLSPYDDPDGFWTLAELPDVRFVVSNTTEAGIALTGDEALVDRPCASYPGKLTQWLYARWKHFGGDPEKGVTVLPVELIDDNAGTLRRYVLELCGKW
ncbi:MAG: tagaturonate reductase, partial [Clostridiales bacterium]|nr:tagaturonate reductase [Clostridiales bacterium]